MSSTPTHDLTPIVPRRTVVTERSYGAAERAVDWLSEEGFPVERVRIVGSGLHSVEKVLGRVTTGRAALMGAAQGGAVGILVGLLFGVFFTTTAAFFGALLYGLLLGTFWGGVWGAMLQYAQRGRREFAGVTETVADQYEVQVDDGVAADAERLLEGRPPAFA